MSRRKRLLSALLVLTALAAIGAGFLFRRQTPPPPLEISLWYWHQPFKIPPSELVQLKAMGIRQLFVRGGTFRKTESGISLVLPQQWASTAPRLDIQLVFNFDYNIVRHYADIDNNSIIPPVIEAVQRQQAKAASAGLNVVGVQFDFDCPTRLLPKYASLLHALKSKIGNPKSKISITALPTWFSSDEVEKVMAEVDFTVPQYYEADIPKTLDSLTTISSLARVERGLQNIGRRGRPFYAGVPAYGHALIFDDRGKLLGTFPDLGAVDAMKHPAFKLSRSFGAGKDGKPATLAGYTGYIGEDILDFSAVENANSNRSKGYHVVYDLPTPALVAQHLELIRKVQPANCLGVILFRYPEVGETQTLPLASLAAALKGEKPEPHLQVKLIADSAPWELIETGSTAAQAPIDLTVTITNTGNASTFISPNAVTLQLIFDRSGIEEITSRNADTVETFVMDSAQFSSPPFSPDTRCSPRRANVVQLRKFHLAAGESVRAAVIRIPADGAGEVHGRWSATSPGGFEVVQGEIASVKLSAHESLNGNGNKRK